MKRVSLLSAILAALTVSALCAQTTGQITGTVTDNTQAPLPGVTVTVTSPVQIGGPKATVTAADGSFSFPALVPGEYKLTANLDGFVPLESEGVQVRLDRTTEVHATLVTPATETIEVTAEAPVVDPEQVSTAQTFTLDYLENAAIGSAGRSYQDILFQVGGVAAQAGAGDNPSVYGSTLGENAFLVDGIDTTDPVTATFGTNFNFDAIQEVSFQTGGFEAEYGRATGGVINVVTKSGGNDFSGTADVRYTGESFTENGEHFDKNAQKNKALTPGATLGGPIVRDRLWFFLADEYNDSETLEAFETATEHFKGNYYLGKLTWQARPNWTLALKHSGDPADIDNAGIGVGIAPEAATFQEQGGTITQADVTGVLSQSLLWEVKAAANRQELNAFPQTRDFSAAAHLDLATNLQTGSSGNAQFSTRDRDELRTSLSYFAGSHEIKGGLERSNLDFESRNFNPAGFFYYDYSALIGPYILLVTDPNPPPTKSSGVLNTAYLQDAWRINDRFTAKLGLRYDQVAFENNVGDEIADMSKLQPRLGLAWDVLGDATTVASVSWGRFMHPSATTLPSFARTNATPTEVFVSCSLVGASSREECEAFFGETISDPDNTDPNGWFLNSVLSSSPNLIQDGLDPTFAEELIVRLERQILPRTSVSLTYVDKDTKDIFEDTCIGNAVSGPSPTADCSTFMMANLGDQFLRRDYKGVILTFETRASQWLHLLGSYTYSKSRGSVEYTQNAGADFDHFPEHFDNTYGYLSDDRRHRVKVNGFARLPWDLTAGFNAFWSSAGAFDHIRTPTEFADGSGGYGVEFIDPRGSHRGNTNYQLDVELKKGFQFGAVRASLIGTVINVLDSERPANRCERDSCTLEAGTPNQHQVGFLEPTSFQLPRSYELGIRFEF